MKGGTMIKKCTSLTLTLSGLFMLLSSIVLYFGPAGQVAHFCPWKFCGLSRHYWGVLHLNSGGLFCAAMLIHTYLNWSLLISYIKMKKANSSMAPLVFAMSLTLYVCVGGCYELPPMKQFLDIARSTRIASMQEYGSPPYGSAAGYPVAVVAGYMGWDPVQSIARLKQNLIVVKSEEQSLNELANDNSTSIGHLLDIMCPMGKQP